MTPPVSRSLTARFGAPARFCAFLIGAVCLAAQPSWFNVRDFGARGDGQSNDAPAIRKAIEAAAGAGGGVVYLPPGNYLSGTLVLRSHVTLHLAPGATLWGSRSMDDYGPPHLIYARDAENIVIEGGGVINGNGEAFWEPDFKPRPHRPSPLLRFERCRRVRIRDIAIRNAPGWTIHPLECDGVWIQGVSIVNHLRGPNTDGIDPDSSRNVFISDCFIEAGDDCIVLKTTGQLSRPAPPCENVIVTRCTLVSDDAALKLGTESLGDFRHILFSDCVIRGTRVGLAIYAKDGGAVEAVRFSRISIDTHPTHRESLQWPVYIDLEKRYEDSPASRVRDIQFSDLTIYTRGRILVGGMPDHPLEDLVFRNVRMRITGFERVETASKPRGSSRVRPVGRELDYASVPAALIFANLRGLKLHDVEVFWEAPGDAPERHALYAARVQDLEIAGFAGRQSAAEGKLAVIGFDQVRRAVIRDSRAQPGSVVFLGLRKTDPNDIRFVNNELTSVRDAVLEGPVHVHLP
jgi:hypothetical protein